MNYFDNKLNNYMKITNKSVLLFFYNYYKRCKNLTLLWSFSFDNILPSRLGLELREWKHRHWKIRHTHWHHLIRICEYKISIRSTRRLWWSRLLLTWHLILLHSIRFYVLFLRLFWILWIRFSLYLNFLLFNMRLIRFEVSFWKFP